MRTYPLTIEDVRAETDDCVSIAFTVPAALKETFRFTPGQYLTLQTDLDGERIRRCYSICSSLDQQELRVAVKHLPGGRFSTFANQALSAGMTLEVAPPEGRFTWQPTPGRTSRYVAFAAGSGITPVISIAQSILEREPHSQFALVYGNRDRSSIVFRERLEDLKDQHLHRLTLIHCLSRERRDIPLFDGRIDSARVLQLSAAKLFDPTAVEAFFLCGPEGMIASTRGALHMLGVSADKIHTEHFVTSSSAHLPAPTSPERARQTGDVHVEVSVDGTARTFQMRPDETVIDAAAAVGIELPYACAGGMCCTCRCRLVKGHVEMAANYSLEAWELEAGFVLACQAKPTTNEIILDFDAR
ncbi:MAG: 2Fe-2S iron-sulfur cluster-binding protein [Myxococcota bacterium]